MVKLGVCGISGKMGGSLHKVLAEQQFADFQLIGGYSRQPGAGVQGHYHDLAELTKEVDIIIDFSRPELVEPLLHSAVTYQVPLVIGTTGLTEEHHHHIREASAKIPIFLASNFSVGVHILSLAAKLAGAQLKDFDIAIREIHHSEKVDSPSGTSIHLRNAIQQAQSPSARDITINVVRGGNIAGIHEVVFLGHGECVSFMHHAQSREVFAYGALRAARWLLQQREPGLYSMEDMLC